MQGRSLLAISEVISLKFWSWWRVVPIGGTHAGCSMDAALRALTIHSLSSQNHSSTTPLGYDSRGHAWTTLGQAGGGAIRIK